MRSREVVTKDNYKQIVLKRMIIVCWILLAVCFVVKIFGGNFFNIICENKGFIKVCDYIENTFWYYVLGYFSTMLGTMLLWCCMLKDLKLTKRDYLFLAIIITILYVIQSFLNNTNPLVVSFIFSIIKFILIPLFVFRCNWKIVLLVNVLDFGMQFISSFIKNVSVVKTIYDNVLICLIFLIDYYIMLGLMYLYLYKTNKKEKIMGLMGSWFLHKDLAELEALLPTIKDANERKACEKRIAKLKEKNSK